MGPDSILGGRFQIIGELGKGSMATVYLADDLVRGTRIALKVLHEHLADDRDARARLTREVRAAGRIQHPNALVAYDIHDLDGRLALSMPVHRGLTLADLIDADGPLCTDDLARLAQDLSGALAAAHGVGVIHRDVSPNNILVERGKSAVLVDFGLARLEGHSTRTGAGGPGTWGFAAPEVYSGSHGDPRSDVYSLGACLYLAAAGKAPFADGNPAAILRRQLDGDHTPLAQLRPDLPPALVSAIEGMLVVDPEFRSQGAREVLDGLRFQEPPNLPVAQVETAGLDVGQYTLIVEKTDEQYRGRRGLRNGAGEVALDEDAAPERALAKAVWGTAVPMLPAAMRRREFKLVEGVSHQTAERLANESVRLGFVPRIINDPRVLRSKRSGQWLTVLGIFASMAAVGSAALGIFDGVLAGFIGSAAFGIVGAFSIHRGQDQMRLRLAFHRAPPALDGPVATSSADPLLRMYERTDTKLQVLEAALLAQDDLPQALHQQIASTLGALRKRAADLVEPAKRLGLDLDLREDPDVSEAVGRIHKRLQRLNTLAKAGEFVDQSERESLEIGLSAHQETQRAREQAENLRTRIAARLLEIGAAATRSTRTLRRDGDLAGSVRTLLEQLVSESEAAAAVLEEMQQYAVSDGAEPLRRPRQDVWN